ncbi:unnamed protein product [Ixodes hexagonus]
MEPWDDLSCPVCLNVRDEPVTMPCGHGVCLACFHKSVQLANKECPLCRRRIGSWARRATREGTLVDEALRARIRRRLRNLPRSRREQQTGERPEETTRGFGAVVDHQLSTPGEIRLEFEEQTRLEAERLERERLEQLRAGEALAQALALEERRAWQEQQEQMERRDRELALQLSAGESLASRGNVAQQVEADLRLARQLQRIPDLERTYALRPRSNGPAC